MSAKNNPLKDKLALPVIAAPMFLISNPKMALECCKEGVVGSFPALNQRTSEGLEKWLVEMNEGIEKLKKENPGKPIAPYAVNLFVNKANPRLEEDLELIVKHKVPVVITSLGANEDVVKKIQSYGGIVLHDVTNVKHAKKAADAGVDGLIAVAAGAGGHAGTMNPIALATEIRKFHDGVLVLAGCVNEGKDVLAAQALGADYAYMGTRFISTKEAAASDEYKKMLRETDAADIIYTAAISGVPGNFIRQSLENAGYDPDELRKLAENTGKLKGLDKEATAWRDVWSAGQGAGTIDDEPTVSELIQRLKTEYADAKLALFRETAADLSDTGAPAQPAAANDDKKQKKRGWKLPWKK